MDVKITNSDGSSGMVSLPEGATLDSKGMGMLATDQVGAFKTKYLDEGKKVGQGELDVLKTERDALMGQVTTLKDGLSTKNKGTVEQSEQMATLQASLEELKGKYEQEQQAKSKIAFKDELRTAVDGVQLIPQAFEVLAQHIEAKRVDGGFMGADGSTINLNDAVAQWTGSDLGKALILSGEKGGANSSTATFSGETFAAYYKAGKTADYIEKYGREKFNSEMMAFKAQQATK